MSLSLSLFLGSRDDFMKLTLMERQEEQGKVMGNTLTINKSISTEIVDVKMSHSHIERYRTRVRKKKSCTQDVQTARHLEPGEDNRHGHDELLLGHTHDT